MKDMSIIKPFRLNLLNFESSAASNCQYVLTSPRSLKACKKAGIKPVELLHRSLTDIIEDFNLPLDVAHSIYEQHERDRQAKIQICQNIRNRLISEETKNFKNNVGTIRSVCSRKEILDQENLLKASSTSASKGNTSVSSKESEAEKKHLLSLLKTETSSSSPISLYSSKLKTVSPDYTTKTIYDFNSQRGIETSSISSSSFSPPSSPHQCSSTLPLKKYEVKYSSKPRKFYKKKRLKRQTKKSPKTNNKDIDNEDIYNLFPKSFTKYYPQIANYFNGKLLNSKILGNEYSKDKCNVGKKSLNKTKPFTRNKIFTEKKNSCTSPMQLNDNVKNKIFNKKYSHLWKNDFYRNESVDKSGEVESNEKGVKKKTTVKRGSLQNLSTHHLTRDRQFCSSTSSLGTVQPKRKDKTYAFLNVDKLKIPESDRRILETLALKKEQEKECEDFAYRAHLLWEADQQRRKELENQKKKKWQQIIEEKRRLESQENLMRMEEVKENLRLSQKILEENIRKRNEQTEKLIKQAEEKRVLELLEKKAVECKRRAIVDANLRQKELDSAIYQQKLQQELEERLERAEHAREKEKELTHRRVASANRVEEIRHRENLYDVNAEKELLLEQKRRELEEREEKSRQYYIEYLKHKEKHIQENRSEREMRLEIAREMQRELEKGFEAWQDQVLLLQCSALERAMTASNLNIENKRLQVECENTQRQLEHLSRLRRVKEIENMKKEGIQNTIKVKEEKIQYLQKQREKMLQEGRTQAHITADLRENLRRTLSPETFDRKVARAELECRVGYRPLTASPTMTESHIQLG
ncbi:uncharacterized protein LOC142332839 [Lycorma delicatula]|uniref:uncharacterized protein LOC142332839 n=1 Tax=Lycorma delicatula TaxID=130591 RepID=UPI003F50E9FB